MAEGAEVAAGAFVGAEELQGAQALVGGEVELMLQHKDERAQGRHMVVRVGEELAAQLQGFGLSPADAAEVIKAQAAVELRGAELDGFLVGGGGFGKLGVAVKVAVEVAQAGMQQEALRVVAYALQQVILAAGDVVACLLGALLAAQAGGAEVVAGGVGCHIARGG